MSRRTLATARHSGRAMRFMRSISACARLSSSPVAAYERLVPHLATRDGVWMFPRGLGEAQYVLERVSVAGAVPADRFAEVTREGPWVLWRRR